MSAKKPLVLDSNANIQQIQSGDFVDVAWGGTGATTASQALVNLGAYPSANPSNFINSAGAPVQSVAGHVGAVVLAQADIAGLTTSSSPTFNAVTASTFTGGLVGNANTATVANNLAGGSAGEIAYQTAAGTTGFSTVGVAGQIVVSGGAGAPTYINQNAITLQSSQVTNALGFTPYSNGNPSNYVNAAGAIAASLTGYTSSAGTVTSSDSILSAIGKLNGNTLALAAAVTGSNLYIGVWNASTNTPILASGVGTKGNYYKVNVAGTTLIDGVSQWNVGDMLTFDGTVWDKTDGLPSEVTTVAGKVGAVVLAQADIAGLTTSSTPTFAGVTASTFTGAFSGNATTATTLATGNTINGVTFTGAAPITIAAAANTLTGTTLANTVITSSLTSVGVITAGTWSGSFGAVSGANLTNITAAYLNGSVAIANGGTGATSAAAAATNLGLGTTNTPTFAGVNAPNTISLTNDVGASVPIGSAVYTDTSGTFMLAKASADGTSNSIGVALATITTGSLGEIATNGPVTATTAQWNAITGGSTGLTAGANYFLSNTTAGMLTTVAPTTGYVLKVGTALSSTVLNVSIGIRVQL